jgi:hypothetical protein
MGPEEALEALERALEEIEALRAIYGYDAGGFVLHSEAELLAAQAAVELGAAAVVAGWAAPRLDIELRISLDQVDDAPAARLRCGMPPGYPARAASVSVSVAGLRRKVGV